MDVPGQPVASSEDKAQFSPSSPEGAPSQWPEDGTVSSRPRLPSGHRSERRTGPFGAKASHESVGASGEEGDAAPRRSGREAGGRSQATCDGEARGRPRTVRMDKGPWGCTTEQFSGTRGRAAATCGDAGIAGARSYGRQLGWLLQDDEGSCPAVR